MLDKKLENKHNPSILFLATYWNLSLINGNLEKKKSSKSGEFWPFSPWKILCIGRNHIFSGRNLAKFRQKGKKKKEKKNSALHARDVD
jgi:hypothetical protein